MQLRCPCRPACLARPSFSSLVLAYQKIGANVGGLVTCSAQDEGVPCTCIPMLVSSEDRPLLDPDPILLRARRRGTGIPARSIGDRSCLIVAQRSLCDGWLVEATVTSCDTCVRSTSGSYSYYSRLKAPGLEGLMGLGPSCAKFLLSGSSRIKSTTNPAPEPF